MTDNNDHLTLTDNQDQAVVNADDQAADEPADDEPLSVAEEVAIWMVSRAVVREHEHSRCVDCTPNGCEHLTCAREELADFATRDPDWLAEALQLWAATEQRAARRATTTTATARP